MLSGVTGLTALAQKVGSKKEEGGSAKWACGLLACMDVWLGRHRKELGKEYEGYRRRVSGMFRWDVVAPRSPLYCALHVDLWKCLFYRGEVELPGGLVELPGMGLMELPCGLAKWMRERMPEEYRVVCGLPRLSGGTWKQWEGPLWGLVKANNPGLRGELAKRYKRVDGAIEQVSWGNAAAFAEVSPGAGPSFPSAFLLLPLLSGGCIFLKRCPPGQVVRHGARLGA